MTGKRYTVHFDETLGNQIWKDGKPFVCVDARHQANKLCIELNELNDENQWLKQSTEDARHILKGEFDFATEQRQKHLDDPVVTTAYDIVRFDMRKALDKLGWLE